MIPHERSLVETYKDSPFVIVGVNSDSDAETLKGQLLQSNVTWRSFFDGGNTHGPIARRFAVHSWPTVYLLDKDRVVRWIGHGAPDEKLLTELIADAAGSARTGGER